MPTVMIDGIEYVPRAEVPELTDERLKGCLQELVSIQYFREQHKAVAQSWDALNALAPELAELSAKDPQAAYERMHGDTASFQPWPRMHDQRLHAFSRPTISQRFLMQTCRHR